MQRVLAGINKLDFSHETILISLLWAVFTFAIPTKVGNFDFRHFVENEGLTLSVSRSAPPMAIIEDERLLSVPTEPLQEIKRTKGSLIIVAGQSAAWLRLQYYSRIFEKQMRRKYLAKLPRRIKPSHLNLSALMKLVKFIPSNDQTPPQVYAVNFMPSNKRNKKTRSVQNVRAHVEQPLTAPSVPRGLPRGEDVAPTVIDGDKVSYNDNVPAMVAVAVRPAVEPAPITVATAKVPTAPAITYIPTRVIVPASEQERSITKRSPASIEVVQAAPPEAPVVTAQVKEPAKAIDVADTGFVPGGPGQSFGLDQGQEKPADIYKIVGQVELAGGLVATGAATKLDIQWRSGGQSRVGGVDYSSGQFYIEVPTLESGKVIARLTNESGFVLGTGEYEIEGNLMPGQQTLQGVSLLVETPESEIKGQIISAYNVDNVFVPLIDGEVFAPASAQDVADKRGGFRLTGLGSESTMIVEAYAQENWGTRVLTSARRHMRIPVFAMKMMESFFSLIGGDLDKSDYGVIWGQAVRHGKPMAGVQVKLASANTPAIYFNELRIPDKKLTATSSNGLYAFAKVDPGIQVVTAQYSGSEIPSSVVSVSPSRVAYTEISFKSLTIEGRVFDPVEKTPVSAQVSLLGASTTTQSTDQGFSLKAPSSDPVLFLEAKPGPNYFVSRQAISRPEAKSVQLYAYKKDWIKERFKKAGIDYSDKQSFVVGYVSGPSYHVQLDDVSDPRTASEKSQPQVYYFGEKGELDSTRLDGLANGGAFIMTALAPGLHTLVVQASAGDVNTSRIFIADEGVANIVSLSLLP